MASKTQMLIEALEPLASEHALDLVTVEVAGTTKNPILRVFLDGLEGGITLDQLSEAQEWVDDTIERIDPFQYSYTLEVSSPGIDRPLRKPSDFERFAGSDVVVYLKAGSARQKLTGQLKGLAGEDVVVCEEDGEEQIPLQQIKTAHIKGSVDFDDSAFDALETTTEEGRN